jgi:hypothetical protein
MTIRVVMDAQLSECRLERRFRVVGVRRHRPQGVNWHWCGAREERRLKQLR